MTTSSNRVGISGAAAKLAMETERLALRQQYAGWTAEQIWERNRIEAELATKFARAGVAIGKRWVSLHDGKTRDSHLEADGQFAILTDFFVVGDEKCYYPGDNMLSAKERIHCRCVVIFEDENGRDLKSYRTQKLGKKRVDQTLAQF